MINNVFISIHNSFYNFSSGFRGWMIESTDAFYLLSNAERTRADDFESQFELFARFAAVGSAISNLIDSCMKKEKVDEDLFNVMLRRDLETHIDIVNKQLNTQQKICGTVLHNEITLAKTTLLKTGLFLPQSLFMRSITNNGAGLHTRTTSQYYDIAKTNYHLSNRDIDGTKKLDENSKWKNPFEISQDEEKTDNSSDSESSEGDTSSVSENEEISVSHVDEGKIPSTKNNNKKIILKPLNNISINKKRNNNATSNTTTKKKCMKIPSALANRKVTKEELLQSKSYDNNPNIQTKDQLESADKKEELFEEGFDYDDIKTVMDTLDYLNFPQMKFFDEQTNRNRIICICCKYHCSRPKKCEDESDCPYEASHGKELNKLQQESLNKFILVCKEYNKKK